MGPAFRPPVFRIRTGLSLWPSDAAENLCATPSLRVLGKATHRMAVPRNGRLCDLAFLWQGRRRRLRRPGALVVATPGSACGIPQGAVVVPATPAGDLLYTGIALGGLPLLAERMGPGLALTEILGGGYLVWFGMRMWPSPIHRGSECEGMDDVSTRPSFRTGLLMTLADHKAVVFYFGLFPLFVDPLALDLLETLRRRDCRDRVRQRKTRLRGHRSASGFPSWWAASAAGSEQGGRRLAAGRRGDLFHSGIVKLTRRSVPAASQGWHFV